MSAPSKAYTIKPVKIRSEERLATTSELNFAPGGVTCRREARGKGYRAATQVKGLSPEISIVPAVDVFHIGGKQYSHSRYRQDYRSPAGSETVARYQTDSIGTREARIVPIGVCVIKSEKGEMPQMVMRESDQFIVALKQGNSCGAKGLAVESKGIGETFAVQRGGERKATEPIFETVYVVGRKNLLKSRMWEIYKSGSVRGFVASSSENLNHWRWL